MGPYKPLRNWVDEFIPYYIYIYGNNGSLDPSTYETRFLIMGFSTISGAQYPVPNEFLAFLTSPNSLEINS